MSVHGPVAIATLLSLLVYVWMIMRVGGARRRSGISAPAMTGDPDLERHIRVHLNTLEWLPLYLPSLWLFALAWNQDLLAAGLGGVWMLGRILYALGYVKDPGKRELGFMVQGLATAILLFGALGKLVWSMVMGG
jgi:uncharacterized membrane protein YecN with MAPEG domain